MKHFAYPATIFSCVKQPLQGEKKNNIKISKTDCSSVCLMVLKSSPVCHALAGLVLPFSHVSPITLSSLSLAHSRLGPCPAAGAGTALRRIPPAPPAFPGDTHSQKRCSEANQHHARTDGQQGSPAAFDKVEVRVHFIRSIDGNVEL